MSASINELVARRLERMRKRDHFKFKTLPLRESQQPIITISRGSGLAGQEIAMRTAALLGFELYDKNLVEEIAKSAEVRHQIIESLDATVQQTISSWINDRFDQGYFTTSDYLEHLAKVLLTIGQHGEAVILGRGANFVLEPKQTLRVRVVAPLEMRILRYAKKYNLSEKEARRAVLRLDADRTAFIRWHFAADVADPKYYDIVLNAQFLSVEGCAQVIATAFHDRFNKNAN